MNHDIWNTTVRAPSTLKEYRRAVGKFEAAGRDLSNPKDVEEHLAELRARGLSHSTLQIAAAALAFAAKRSGVAKPAAQHQDVVDYMSSAHRADTRQKRKAKPLTGEMLEHAEADHYNILRFGLATGLRRSELVSIRWQNITKDYGELFVPKAKRGSRTLPLLPAAQEALRLTPRRGPWVWVSRVAGCNYISDVTLNRYVKVCAANAGEDPTEYSGHSLRSGFVTAALAAGWRPEQVMNVTGHRSVQQVMEYARLLGLDDLPALAV